MSSLRSELRAILSQECSEVVVNDIMLKFDNILKEKCQYLDDMAIIANNEKALRYNTTQWTIDDFYREGFKAAYIKALWT